MSKPKRRHNVLTDTLETFTESGKHIAKDTAKGVASVVDINSMLYGPGREEPPEVLHKKTEKAVKEFGIDKKTKEENEEMKANHTPLDIQAVRDKHQMQQIQKRLFDFTKTESNKARQESDKKKQERKQSEVDEEEKRKKEKEEAAVQPEEEVHGKDKPKIGEPRKKATTDPHQNFEQKANRGK